MKNILTIPLQILLKGKIFIPRPKIQLLAYYILPLASLAAMVITAGFFTRSIQRSWKPGNEFISRHSICKSSAPNFSANENFYHD
jgi:hypothetical protein